MNTKTIFASIKCLIEEARRKKREKQKAIVYESNCLKANYGNAAHEYNSMVIGRWQRATLDKDRLQARLVSKLERKEDKMEEHEEISDIMEEMKEEVSEFARYYAAQAWCTSKTEKIVMDVILAEAFARIIDELLSEPWLGNATTGELLEELKARIYLDGRLEYRTSERRGEVMKVSE
jgi:hypothetical protein